MKRRSPLFLGLAIGTAAGLLLLGSIVPHLPHAPPTGPIALELGGPISSIVMHFARGSDFVFPVYRQFLSLQPPDLTVYLVCPEPDDFNELTAALGPLPCHLTPIFVHHPLTPWSRDRWVPLLPTADGGPIILLAQAAELQQEIWPARAGDGRIIDDLASTLHLHARRSTLFFDGADLLADGPCVFATPAVLERNLQHRAADLSQLTTALERELGRHVIFMPDAPDHHALMYMVAAGQNRMLVADPSLAAPLFNPDSPTAAQLAGGPDFSPETQLRFDSVAALATAHGYQVTRIPVVPAREGKMYLTFVNVILDQRNSHPLVYMPTYDGQEKLNAAAQSTWTSLGFTVRPINCTTVFARGGALHCLVNILSRS